jgi:hypothetical protein
MFRIRDRISHFPRSYTSDFLAVGGMVLESGIDHLRGGDDKGRWEPFLRISIGKSVSFLYFTPKCLLCT